MPPTVDDVRYDLAMTRARMAATLEELDQRLDEQKDAARGKIEQVKARLDLRDAAREHPWIAIGAAVAVGMLVAGTGADRRAASATADAARALPGAAKSAGSAVVEKVKDLRAGDGDAEALANAAEDEGPGFFGRIADKLGDALQLDRFVAELAEAARDLGAGAVPGAVPGASLDRRTELAAQDNVNRA